ncbi:MAG TPA: Na+/H+ antiporter NhaA, partial [Bradyrhizobium sp.]|nr:Na+/H+ antiporter NhaA [Bradyrhizobium sp.]
MAVAAQPDRSFFQRFIRTETLGGLILLLVAVAALLWANSPWAPFYTALWEIPLAIGVGEHTL